MAQRFLSSSPKSASKTWPRGVLEEAKNGIFLRPRRRRSNSCASSAWTFQREDRVLGSQGSCNLSAIFLRDTICRRSASKRVAGSSFRADDTRSRSGPFILGRTMRGRASARELHLNEDIGHERRPCKCLNEEKRCKKEPSRTL